MDNGRMWYSGYNTCTLHNQKCNSVCLKSECKNRLLCSNCLFSEHRGHVDSHVVPFSKFLGSIHKEFQKIELNRLKRIHFSEDLSQHIANEFKYLKEKSVKVLAERENSLQQLIQKQFIFQKPFQNIIDQINFMSEGQVFEDGLKVVLPLMLNEGGVQESLTRFERDKVKITLKVRESISQIKSILDGLFFIGGISQQEQQIIKELDFGAWKNMDLYYHFIHIPSIIPLNNQSAIYPSHTKRKQQASTNSQGNILKDNSFNENYQEFVDNLYPKYEKASHLFTPNYPVTQFDSQYTEVNPKSLKFSLFGVLEHSSQVHYTLRLNSGSILTCSNQLTFWTYPQLKSIQQTAYNFGITQILEIVKDQIVTLAKESILTYEFKDGKWYPKGEFLTPSIGTLTRICLSEKQCSQDLLCIISSNQLLTYQLTERNLAGKMDNHLQKRPLDHLIHNNHPLVYQHKNDCTCVGFEFDGMRVITGDGGGQVYRWRLGNTFNMEECIQAHNGLIEGIVPLHDGRICSIAQDGLIKLWDQNLSPTAIGVVKHRSSITSVTIFSQELDCFLTGDTKGKLQMWKITITISPVYEIDAHSDQISSIAYNPLFQSQVLTSSNDNKVKIWNLSQ